MHSGVNLYSHFDELEIKINDLDDKVHETNEVRDLIA